MEKNAFPTRLTPRVLRFGVSGTTVCQAAPSVDVCRRPRSAITNLPEPNATVVYETPPGGLITVHDASVVVVASEPSAPTPTVRLPENVASRTETRSSPAVCVQATPSGDTQIAPPM